MALFFDHPACLEHDPSAHVPEHPDTPERLMAVERALAAEDWLGWERRAAPAASEAQLELIHSAAHVRRIEELSLAGRRRDRPRHVRRRALLARRAARRRRSVRDGAALMAREAPLGFCGVRPSGHHAEPDRAMGFCLFNNVALAAEFAIRELGAKRVFILDWDVHHGNGTAEAFRRRDGRAVREHPPGGDLPRHGRAERCRLGRGRGLHDQPARARGLRRGAVALAARAHRAPGRARRSRPISCSISAGFDAHREDPLGGLPPGGRSPSRRWPATCATSPRDLDVPLGAVLEGGYDTRGARALRAATLAALAGDRAAHSAAPEPLLTSRAASHIGHYWPLT